MKKQRFAAVGATAAAVALLVSACGSTQESTGGETQSPTEGASAEQTDFKACMVAAVGGLDDKSFNQSANEGLRRAESELGVQVSVAETQTQADYAPNITNMVTEGCDLIFGISWEATDQLEAAAAENPEIKFALVDGTVNPDLENAKGLVFDTAQATYLAGYAAAALTQTGTVATFLGGKMPPTMLFADGFYDGVAKFNEDNDAEVRLLGWDKSAQDGMATGNFEDVARGKQFTEQLIQQGADIIMPVAGSVSQGALAAAAATPGTAIIWPDVDGYYSEPSHANLMLTSVLKQVGNAVYDTVEEALTDQWTKADYIGTLANDGVGLAPWHDFEDQVPAELDEKLTELRQQIIDGEIVVESASAP